MAEDKRQRAPEECWIWLIWGLKKGACDLLAIASSEKAKERYLEHGRRHGYQHVQAEEVMTGHLYGAGMLGSAMGRKITHT